MAVKKKSLGNKKNKGKAKSKPVTWPKNAFPLGNEIWRKRATHGRKAIFETAQALADASVEYFTYTDSRKWVKKDWVGKDAMEVDRETSPPYTLAGMCVFFGTSRSWWKELRAAKTEAKDTEYLAVMAAIEETMYQQKFEGAAVGAFNSNIISRELGLADKTDLSAQIETKVVIDFKDAE